MIKFIGKFLAAIGVISFTAEVNASDYLDLGAMLSNGNPKVMEDLTLFQTDRKKYFKLHEEELLQRGIESPDEISPAITLIDSLKSIKKVVYADYKEDAGDVLKRLESLANGKLKQSGSYANLVAHMQEKTTANAISNYLENSDAQYLFSCVTEAKYKLVMIDEESDAYPLLLVPLEQFEQVKLLTAKAGVKVKGLEKNGLH